MASDAVTSLVLTDVQLQRVLISLQLICGRNKGGIKNKNRKYVCFLANQLRTEVTLRGLPVPPDNTQDQGLPTNAL